MEAIAQALSPELSHPAGEKSAARLAKQGKALKLSFVARDSSSLRAIMSSYLRMLAATLNVSMYLLELERKPVSSKVDS
jgi:tRNA threonylcarbamoyladenosine modification (KEOPS) complex  Pcc1 subunit